MSLDTTPPADKPSSETPTRLGSYLIEAGLITPAQVAVVLNDQNFTHDMKFGEVLVARGWVKPETIEFVMKRVVEPERQAKLDRQKAQSHSVVVTQSTPKDPVRQPQVYPSQSRSSATAQQYPKPTQSPIAPPMPTTPPRVTTPPIARAKSLDGDFEFEILDDITLSLPNSYPTGEVRNDRKPLPSVPDGGGINWAG